MAVLLVVLIGISGVVVATSKNKAKNASQSAPTTGVVTIPPGPNIGIVTIPPAAVDDANNSSTGGPTNDGPTNDGPTNDCSSTYNDPAPPDLVKPLPSNKSRGLYGRM